jgi:hypothetical protein
MYAGSTLCKEALNFTTSTVIGETNAIKARAMALDFLFVMAAAFSTAKKGFQ